jgi:GT2 family glycosyltransferase
MNRVYVIIVNYNKFEDTIECLESVLKSNYPDFQIFVIDNSSNELSIDHISNWIGNNNNNKDINTNFKNLVYPLEHKPVSHTIVSESEFPKKDELYEDKITIIRAKNNGYAAANNIVLNYLIKNGADSSLIWMLNNDTVVNKDTLSNLAGFYLLNKNGKYILGSKLKYYYNPDIIQAIAGSYNKWLGMNSHVGDGKKDSGQYDNYKPVKMDYIVGASIFLPKLFLEEAGVMSEEYFLYFEEMDWMQRGIKYGFEMAIVPNAVVYHKDGSSIIGNKDQKRDTSTAEYYYVTNRVRFIKKWFPYCLITVMFGVAWALLKRLIQGKFSLVKEIFVSVFKILFT